MRSGKGKGGFPGKHFDGGGDRAGMVHQGRTARIVKDRAFCREDTGVQLSVEQGINKDECTIYRGSVHGALVSVGLY